MPFVKEGDESNPEISSLYKEINDELSEKVFDSYLEILDPQTKYFLVSDFKEFKK